MKVLSLVLLVSLSAFGQGSIATGNPVAVNPAGQPLPSTTVAVCSTYSATVPCASLATIYTDITLSVACSGVAGTQPLNNSSNPTVGTGCSNPGLTDGLGNVVAYSNSGTYWLQYYGSNITTTIFPVIFPASIGGSAAFSNITTQKLNNTIFVDGTVYACNSTGWNAAIAAVPSTGGTVDATGCISGVTLSATVAVGSASTPVKLKLPQNKITCAMTSGSCIAVNGSGSSLVGPGEIALIVNCNNSSLSDIIHVEPASGQNSLNGIDVEGFRVDGTNCPNVTQLNILSVRDASSFHHLDLRFWTGLAINIGISGNSGALISQGLSFRDIYEQSGTGNLTSDSNIIQANEVQWGSNLKVINAGTSGNYTGLRVQASVNGDGRGNNIIGSSYSGYTGTGGCIKITNTVGAGNGALSTTIGPGNEFENATLAWLITGDGVSSAQRTRVFGNFYQPSVTNYGKLDYSTLSDVRDAPTNGNSGAITLTANSVQNTIDQYVNTLTDVSDSGTSNNLKLCAYLNSNNTCFFNNIAAAQTFESRSSNISTSGVFLMANTDKIGWRNGANSGNDLFGVNSSDNLAYANGLSLGGTTAVWTSAAGAPSGNCTVGSLYTNTTASTASTVLYVCQPANTWSAVQVP
jgi:hypothetical protein